MFWNREIDTRIANGGFIVALFLAVAVGCARGNADKPSVGTQSRADVLGYLSDVGKGYVGWFRPRRSKPQLSPVYGIAKRNGRLLSSGQINLIPTETSRSTASGIIATDGSYLLYSGASGLPGVEPGTYKVRLAKDSSKPAERAEKDGGDHDNSASLQIAIVPGPQRLDLVFP